MSHFEKIWRCSCGGTHFLSVSAFDDDIDEYNIYIHVEDYPVGGHWERIKAAFKIIFKRRHTWIELILDKEKAEDIASEILKQSSKLKTR
jgi:hypothetical protein